MLANKVNDPALFGLPLPSGFSSVSDQLVTSLKILYRNQIKPLRALITSGINKVLDYNKEGQKVRIIDFPELRVTTEEPQVTTNLSNQRIGFNYDGVANTIKGRKMIQQAKANRQEVFIISSRNNALDLYSFAAEHNIPKKNIFATGSDLNKIQKIKELMLDIYFDTDRNVLAQLPQIALNF